MNTYPILYAAYGANTNKRHMAVRCPTAVYLGNCILHDYRLIFRGVADVVPAKGQRTVCAVWEIYPADEAALDRFEGYPHHYTKRYAKLTLDGVERTMMFYVMAGDRRDQHEPPKSYEETLREGYGECGMATDQIDRAIRGAEKSAQREKRYRGKWVQQDLKAKKKQSHYLRDQIDLFADYPKWMRDNFNLGNLGEV